MNKWDKFYMIGDENKIQKHTITWNYEAPVVIDEKWATEIKEYFVFIRDWVVTTIWLKYMYETLEDCKTSLTNQLIEKQELLKTELERIQNYSDEVIDSEIAVIVK